MKYIKKFENIKKIPEVGDYVIIRWELNNLAHFLNNNIGQIAYKSPDNSVFTVKYDNIPNNIKNHFVSPGSLSKDRRLSKSFNLKEILHFSKDIKELELELTANKYNL